MKKISIFIIGIAIFVMATNSVHAFDVPGPGYFGGPILVSQFRVCLIGVGPFALYVPMQVLYLGAPTYKTVEYIWYTAILQAFGVTNSIYFYGQFYHKGPNVIGSYLGVTIPWENCEDLNPTNIITKIGTSAF